MSEMAEVDYEQGGATAQEDFRAFMENEERNWGGLDDDSLAELEEDEYVQEEEEEEEVEEPSSRREGTDAILRRLRQSDPEAARIVSGMQRKMHQNINEWNTLRAEVLDLREQLLTQRNGEPHPAPVDEKKLPEGVTEQHLEMFRHMADHLGYLPRQELEGREAEARSQQYVNNSIAQAYEEFGEDFGYEDENGNIRILPEVQERLNRRLQELQDSTRGITPLDLYKLEFGGRSAPRRARSSAPAEKRQNRPSPGATVRRSSRGNVPVRIYDPKRGDSAEDVFDRAWALGKRQLTGQ